MNPNEAPDTGAVVEPLFDPLLTVKDVSAWLGKPVGTLWQWRTRGKGPKSLKIEGSLRYRRSDILAYLDACASDSPAERSA